MIHRLILPGIFTAAAHAFVLLGLDNGNPPPITPGNMVEIEPPWAPPKPLPPDPPARDDYNKGPADKIEVTAPPLPGIDPVVTNPSEGLLTTPLVFNPHYDKNLTGPITTIPPGRPGTGDGDGKDGKPVVDFSMLDNKPRTRVQTAPVYPHTLKTSGVEGSVTVAFEVDERGYVAEARVVESTHREFEEPTLRAVGKWRFEPGRKNGVPVRFRMQVPVMFSLNDLE
jgi:protein TonB